MSANGLDGETKNSIQITCAGLQGHYGSFY